MLCEQDITFSNQFLSFSHSYLRQVENILRLENAQVNNSFGITVLSSDVELKAMDMSPSLISSMKFGLLLQYNCLFNLSLCVMHMNSSFPVEVKWQFYCRFTNQNSLFAN